MRRLTLASASAVTRAFPSSARECSTPHSRVLDRSLTCVTRDCSTARLHVTCECWKLESSAHGPQPSARRSKLIRPYTCSRPCTCENKPSLALRDFAVLLWPSEPPRFLFRCSGIRALFSKPPCFFSEPAPHYLL